MSKEDMSWVVERGEDIKRICTESYDQGREQALEEAAIAAWSCGMDRHNKLRGLPSDAREIGSLIAKKIRSLKSIDKA